MGEMIHEMVHVFIVDPKGGGGGRGGGGFIRKEEATSAKDSNLGISYSTVETQESRMVLQLIIT